jgi:hypothetical protein
VNTATEPETLAELISDCAEIPGGLRSAPEAAPLPPAPRAWSVDEACHSRVAGLEDYA